MSHNTPEQLRDGAGEVARTRVYAVTRAEDRLGYSIGVIPQRQDPIDRYLNLAPHDPTSQPTVDQALVREEISRQALGADQLGAQRPEPTDINGASYV